MTTYVYIAQSLDGFIADKNGGLEWLNEIPNPDNSDFGFAEFMSKIDAVVMGRNTFEKVHSFGMWPYTKPVYVVSTSLNELPKEYTGKAKILNLTPSQIIEKLNKLYFPLTWVFEPIRAASRRMTYYMQWFHYR